MHVSVSRIGKFIFFVDVESSLDGSIFEVKLCPDEHRRFVWASEEEVKASKAGEFKLEFTTPELEATVLEAFKLRSGGGRYLLASENR